MRFTRDVSELATWLAKLSISARVAGGKEDGGFGGTFEEAFDQLIANTRIEAAEGLTQDDEAALKGEGSGEGEFHSHATRKSLDFAIERPVELLDERWFERSVPSGIKLVEIFRKRSDFHPLRNFLIFGDVSDLAVELLRMRSRHGLL